MTGPTMLVFSVAPASVPVLFLHIKAANQYQE